MEDVATPVPVPEPSDDLVHFNQAAKVLEVSRKTVERMAGSGKLERAIAPNGEPVQAHVTKRSLVEAMEAKRGEPVDLSRLTQEVSQSPLPQGAAAKDFYETIQPILQQVIDAEARASEFEIKVKLLEQQTDSNKDRDELLGRLVAGSWKERRKARREALERLVREKS